MSKTFDTDPMMTRAALLRTQPLPSRGEGATGGRRVDTQPLPIEIEHAASSTAEQSEESARPDGDAKSFPIMVPSPSGPSAGASPDRRVDTQPLPFDLVPEPPAPLSDLAADTVESSPLFSSGAPGEGLEETTRGEAKSGLREEDLPDLYRRVMNGFADPSVRLEPPVSEEMRYIAPRPVTPKNKTPLPEQPVVVRRSVMEPVIVPPSRREAEESAASERLANEPLPRAQRNAQTVISSRAASKRRVLVGALTAGAVAIVGAGALIFALGSSATVASPGAASASSALPVRTALPEVSSARAGEPQPPSSPVPLAASSMNAASPEATAESVPRATALRSRATGPVPSPAPAPNRFHPKPVQPSAEPSASSSVAAPNPFTHSDLFGQERSK